MFIEKSLLDYIDLLRSGDHIPGGGSASALVGSLGTGLIEMVYNLTKNKKVYLDLRDDTRSKLDKSFRLLTSYMEDLKSIVDEDTIAFNGVIKAYRLPKDSEDRPRAIEEGYKKALETPLRLSSILLSIMRELELFAKYGNVTAITDIGIGVLFLYAALESSNLNIRINLNSIKDVEFKKDIEVFLEDSIVEAKDLRDGSMEIVYSRLK